MVNGVKHPAVLVQANASPSKQMDWQRNQRVQKKTMHAGGRLGKVCCRSGQSEMKIVASKD